VSHALLGRAPLAAALPMMLQRRQPPDCLSREAVLLVQDALAKGCVWRLARQGGWLSARHVRGDRVASGRLWERTPPEGLGLTFSGVTLKFLIGLTAGRPEELSARSTPTVGDELLLFYAYEALRATLVCEGLRGLRPVFRNELVRLAFPDDFAEPRFARKPVFSTWVVGVGACVQEAFQPYLAERWVAVERRKLAINDVARMRALGGEQETTLEALLRALDRAGRWDLARFLLSAASQLLPEDTGPRPWVGSLDLNRLRVADRAAVHRAALAVLRSLDRLRQWERRARAVGYFDEGYAASQLWKADWEAFGGEAVCERAGAIVRALHPLGA
jgi:hypothetical protein